MAPGVPSLASPANGSSTNDTTPTLDWSDSSGATSYQVMYDDNSGFSSPDIWTTSNSYYTLLSSAAGTYYWKVRAGDESGNWSALSSAFSFTIDTTAPTGNSISINGGTSYTSSTSVTLTLASTGASLMQFSNDGSSYGSWVTYATSHSLSLIHI